MEGKMLLLMGRNGEWTYARLTAIEIVGDYINIMFIPRANDDVLKNILSEYFGFLGLACEAHTCHASVREVSTQHANGEELFKINCRRVDLKRTLDLIAEEKVRHLDSEWDMPSRNLGSYDGMMGFAAALPVRPGFVTLVNQVAWRILLGRNMPFEYGQKGRISDFTDAKGTEDPSVRRLMDAPCPFRLLYPILGHNREDFINLSRLFAGYLLMNHGVVHLVNEFTIEAGSAEQINISLKGMRAGLTRDDLPIHVFVQGTYLLEPSPVLT